MKGWALLGWMFLRSFAGPFFRVASPFVAWALPLLLFLLALRLRWNESEKRWFARTVAALGAVEAALMLCQRFGCDPLFGAVTSLVDYAPGRMIGTVGYQNQAAEFLGVALVCAVVGWRSMVVRISAAVLLAGTMVLTANRGALLALVATVGMVLIPRLVRSRRRVALSVAAALLVAVLFSVPQTRARLVDLARPSRSPAVQSRIWMGRAALSLWRDHPMLGAGAGGYAYEYIDRLGSLLPPRKEHALLRALVWAREAHCDFLQFAAEFGLVGIVLSLCFLASLARSFRRAGDMEWTAAFFLSCCSLFSFSWQTSLAAPTTGLLLGMAAGSRGGALPVTDVSEDDQTSSAPSGLLSVVASVFVLFIIAIEALACHDLEDAYWDAASGETPILLRGGRRAAVAAIAFQDGHAALAASLCEKAGKEWTSPDLLIVEAQALEAVGRREDAADRWRRLERCGLRHDEALRGLSRCLERCKRLNEAASVEAERFRLWPNLFSDEEVYRLCAIKVVAGDAAYAEWLSRRFRDRAAVRGETEEKWTPEWANLRGGALLALGRNAEARECFEDAVRRKPELVSAHRNLQSVRGAERTRTGAGGAPVLESRVPSACE